MINGVVQRFNRDQEEVKVEFEEAVSFGVTDGVRSDKYVVPPPEV